MALKIRLRKQGRTNRPFYRLVVTDGRCKRDGRYLECLGWYNPFEDAEKQAKVEGERIIHWLDQGAEFTEKSEALVKRVAPEAVRHKNDKAMAQLAKAAAKRRARKKAAA